mgnify:CR=1 FL=1
MSNSENIVIGFPEPVKMARGVLLPLLKNLKSKKQPLCSR